MGMMDTTHLSEICRRAQEICKNHDSSLTCDVFDASASPLASIYSDSPSEGDVGVMVVGQEHSQFDMKALAKDLEQIDGVWGVFLAFGPRHSTS
jgi:translation initiation factor 1 (eIF-1/SUI1)